MPLSHRKRSHYMRAMARPKPTEFEKTKIVAENRRARFDYFIEDV